MIEFTAIPRAVRILSQFAAIIVIILLLMFKQIYFREDERPKNFTFPVFIFIVAMLLSGLVARYYHHQPYFLSVWMSRAILFYFLYFLLHAYKIEKAQLEKIIIGLGLLTVGLFYFQTVLYPTKIFDVRMTIDRGTLRLFIPTMGFTLISYFYFLNKFFNDNKIKHGILVLLCYSIFILQATRQLIASIALLTIINLFRSKQVRSRLLIVFLIGLGMVAMFFIFFDLINEMIAVSQQQIGAEEESTRMRAARFFLTKFPPNDLAYILGNGEGHQASPYGMKMLYLQLTHGYYLSDIGLIGDYVRYGILFVIGAIIMLVKLIRIKVPPEYEYLRYQIFLSLFTLLTGKGVFGSPSITLILIAYLFDIGHHELRLKQKNKNESFNQDYHG